MDIDNVIRLLHVGTASLLFGALAAMLFVQSLLSRSLDDAERKPLARLALTVARLLVNPVAILAFLTGVGFLFSRYGALGPGKVMACAPVYVHVMLGFGFFATGFVGAWKARVRKALAALEAGSAAEAKAHVTRGFAFAGLAMVCVALAMVVVILRVPNPPRLRCVADEVVRPVP